MRLIDADALMESIGCADAVKYGNRDRAQQDISYSTRMLYEIRGEIDAQPTVDGWISAKDRLPEYTGWYLTYHHKINLCVVSWFTGDGWEDGDWGAYEDGWVSHWMPLPEDPKEVSGDG